MLQKLIVDRILDLPPFDATIPPIDATFPLNFAYVPDRIYSIRESSHAGSLRDPFRRSSQVTAGMHATKAHRTFRWLPWLLGEVGCMRFAGSDILTGRMTGCWLVIFRLNSNNVEYAGHIGTDSDPSTPNSVQAKTAWRSAVTNNLITPVAAFNPVGANLPANNRLNLKDEAAEFYGVFEPATRQVYTAVLAAQGITTRRRIASVVHMPTTVDVVGF